MVSAFGAEAQGNRLYGAPAVPAESLYNIDACEDVLMPNVMSEPSTDQYLEEAHY